MERVGANTFRSSQIFNIQYSIYSSLPRQTIQANPANQPSLAQLTQPKPFSPVSPANRTDNTSLSIINVQYSILNILYMFSIVFRMCRLFGWVGLPSLTCDIECLIFGSQSSPAQTDQPSQPTLFSPTLNIQYPTVIQECSVFHI